MCGLVLAPGSESLWWPQRRQKAPVLVSSCSRLEMGLTMLGADPEAVGTGRRMFLSLPGLADGKHQHKGMVRG